MVRVGNNLFRNDFASPEWDVGYYFSDETEQLHGPFDSLDAAQAASTEYAKQL